MNSFNKENLNNDQSCPNLLIIDSLTALFSPFKASNNFDLNYYVNYVSTHLKYLACNMNMAIVVITNNNEYNTSYTYSASSYSSTISFNRLYNSTWKNVPNLIVEFKHATLLNKTSSENQSSPPVNAETVQYVRKMEILQCNRTKINESLSKSCYFKIDEFGFSDAV